MEEQNHLIFFNTIIERVEEKKIDNLIYIHIILKTLKN